MHAVGQYQIEIYSDPTYDAGSADNTNNYERIHFVESEYRFPTMFGIKVFENGDIVGSAIIGSAGGATGLHKNSVIYEDSRMLICCSDSIFCLSIPDLSLIWRTQADDITCFGIFKYQNSYIVHGEMEISRLDEDGNILWHKGGADIFVTMDGKDGFQLIDDYIIVKDFDNRTYIFRCDGEELKQPKL